MKQIETLVDDIYKLLGDGLPEDFPEEKVNKFGLSLARLLVSRMDGGKDYKPGLRMSNIGTPCERKLWYGINQPEAKEEIPPWVRMKFLFGDILEHLLLFMADAAGHQVEGTQDEQEIEGVKGHRDSVIDGVIIDAKSASTYSFKKFADHKLDEDDPFGYVDQIQSYLHAGQSDPIVPTRTEQDSSSLIRLLERFVSISMRRRHFLTKTSTVTRRPSLLIQKFLIGLTILNQRVSRGTKNFL